MDVAICIVSKMTKMHPLCLLAIPSLHLVVAECRLQSSLPDSFIVISLRFVQIRSYRPSMALKQQWPNCAVYWVMAMAMAMALSIVLKYQCPSVIIILHL